MLHRSVSVSRLVKISIAADSRKNNSVFAAAISAA
jgi:hypothetical protein